MFKILHYFINSPKIVMFTITSCLVEFMK